ncbi:MAG TPA: 1-deoxy-D-xylulose-5-phosphate reductoisomerase [Gammaproteobacteria bacterium]|nr:1-deoxy-D-xylulose-5-phosphate reductoisomerase [Gammaproteobacteria bacterium]
MKREGIAILGSTGSIGLSTLDVLRQHADRYRVVALTAFSQVERLFEQIREFRPEVAVMVDEAAAERLVDKVRKAGLATRVLAGAAALGEVAVMEAVDQIMAAIVGAAGLLPTLAAAEAGKRILLANKEALVMSGSLLLEAVQRSGARLLPIDSEHNAIFQCLPAHFERGLGQVGVQEILLTGSGGPFRELPLEDLAHVTPDQACAHPNWSMGRKISVDSATMMNKGLELIEACLLFQTTPDRIRIVVHPQSVIHSMVQYVDGSVLAQLGQPDMRTPIAHALAWPERMSAGVEPLDFYRVGNLEFQAPDPERFPALRLAENAARHGGTAPAILNAANEVAVAAFLEGRIRFTQIAELVEDVVNRIAATSATDLDTILAVDRQARAAARDWITHRSEDRHP